MSKPHITLKIGGGGFNSQNNSPVVATPGGGPKFKLTSMGGMSKPSTPGKSSVKPLVKPAPKTKAGRTSKPSAKLTANKNGKRTKEDSEDENGGITANRSHATETGRLSKKVKLNLTSGPKTPKTPTILKTKFKGKPPKRPFGEGYDSEASDREEDPLIEEEFVLRMAPGEDCEYMRRMIEEKRIGIGKKEGGADVQMKFLHPEGRRVLLTIQGRHYAATLVDLPCVIEGMKSWDKKGWYKAADICQMLYVFAQVPSETAAGTIDLPRAVDPNTFQYPHGITPPMHNARKRRFRKRLHRSAIEAVEDAVEKLLDADAHAESTRFEIIDPEGSYLGSRAPSTASPGEYGNGGEEYSEEEDAEGEADDGDDYFGHVRAEEEQAPPLVGEAEDEVGSEENMEAALEAALEAEFMEAGTPLSNTAAEDPDAVFTNGDLPEPDGEVEGSGEESSAADDDDDDDDDDDADGEDEIDEDERARLEQLQGAKEDIVEMEKQLGNLEAQMATQANPILKRRIKDNIEKVKAELQLRKSAIGEADED